MVLDKIKFYLNAINGDMEFLDIPVTSLCNLNCKYCNTFAPLAEKWSLDLDNLRQDTKKLSELFNIKTIDIIGGEPLLYKDIVEVFKIVRQNFTKSRILLITNGILLDKKDKDFYDAIKEFNIDIQVTQYPNVKVSCPVKYTSDRRFSMNKYILDLKGRVNPKKAFDICPFVCDAFLLFEHKLYIPCTQPFIQLIHRYLQTKDLPKDSGLNIHEYNNGKDLLVDLCSLVPDACRFCRGYIMAQPWELSNRKIEEYTL